jgi:predicted HD phosphohydrolase
MSTEARTAGRTPLMRPDWGYAAGRDMEEITREDWEMLARQKTAFLAERQANHVLSMFRVAEDQPSFGYEISMYRHGLQAATLMHRAGFDEETVVVGLLHDIAYDASPDTHGVAAAAMFGPYCSDRNLWMLRWHQDFGAWHSVNYPGVDRHARERFRGHPHFEFTARFVAEFDQTTIRADLPTLPLDAFVPMVHRFFAKPPRAVELP